MEKEGFKGVREDKAVFLDFDCDKTSPGFEAAYDASEISDSDDAIEVDLEKDILPENVVNLPSEYGVVIGIKYIVVSKKLDPEFLQDLFISAYKAHMAYKAGDLSTYNQILNEIDELLYGEEVMNAVRSVRDGLSTGEFPDLLSGILVQAKKAFDAGDDELAAALISEGAQLAKHGFTSKK